MAKDKVSEFISSPKKALFKLSLPVLASMFVQVLYNLVDTAFVGRLGPEAIAAVTFAFPVFIFMVSLNMGLGVGMGSRISRSLGGGYKKRAESTATHGVLISLVLALIVFLLGSVFINPLLYIFGAQGSSFSLAHDYLSVIFTASFFIFLTGIFNQIFVAQGDTKTPMKITITALIINMVLDPIFIYYLGLGVKGAAYATALSFAVGLVLFIIAFIRLSDIHFIIRGFRLKGRTIKDILYVGGPASITMFLMSIYMTFINKFMAHFGTEYVALFGIVARMESLAIMPMAAVSISMVTLTGMFYGAKQFEILNEMVWFALKLVVSLAIIVGVFYFAVPEFIFRIFTNDPRVIELGAAYMRINVFTFPFMAITVTVSRVMQGLGYGLPGMAVNFTRVLVFAVPLSFVFIYILGLPYLSVPVAGIVGGGAGSIVGVVWYKILFEKCRKGC
ncbi:MAG: MATE family efflux transporter [Nanoarchaeota archaeon]